MNRTPHRKPLFHALATRFSVDLDIINSFQELIEVKHSATTPTPEGGSCRRKL
jgi:hypothetical protein